MLHATQPRPSDIPAGKSARSTHPHAPRHRSMLGHLGEMMAADRLRKEGYLILERNYRCAQGEIDLVAAEDGVLVFVEVRTRTSEGFGSPLETIDHEKRCRLRNAARSYLRERNPACRGIRFDVVGILLKEGAEAQIEIVPHAFYQGQRV
jgi:putative endonuclease